MTSKDGEESKYPSTPLHTRAKAGDNVTTASTSAEKQIRNSSYLKRIPAFILKYLIASKNKTLDTVETSIETW